MEEFNLGSWRWNDEEEPANPGTLEAASHRYRRSTHNEHPSAEVPHDVSRETAIVPDRPDWRVADGIDIMPGTTR